MSGDGASVMGKFRRAIGAAYSFVSDPDAHLIKAYGAKVLILKRSKRVTYVIGTDRKITRVDEGADAIDAANAVGACSLG